MSFCKENVSKTKSVRYVFFQIVISDCFSFFLKIGFKSLQTLSLMGYFGHKLIANLQSQKTFYFVFKL